MNLKLVILAFTLALFRFCSAADDQSLPASALRGHLWIGTILSGELPSSENVSLELRSDADSSLQFADRNESDQRTFFDALRTDH